MNLSTFRKACPHRVSSFRYFEEQLLSLGKLGRFSVEPWEVTALVTCN